MAVGGIRISHMSDIAEPITMALTATKGSRKPFTVRPLKNSVPPSSPTASPPLAANGNTTAGTEPRKTAEERLAANLANFEPLGVTREQLEAFMGVPATSAKVAHWKAAFEHFSKPPDDFVADYDRAEGAT